MWQVNIWLNLAFSAQIYFSRSHLRTDFDWKYVTQPSCALLQHCLTNSFFSFLELMMEEVKELAISLTPYLCWEHMCSNDQALAGKWQHIKTFMSWSANKPFNCGTQDVNVCKFESKADLTTSCWLTWRGLVIAEKNSVSLLIPIHWLRYQFLKNTLFDTSFI